MESLRFALNVVKKQLLDLFPPTSNTSLYSDHGCSYICSECIAKKIDVNRLETVDKMCQFFRYSI